MPAPIFTRGRLVCGSGAAWAAPASREARAKARAGSFMRGLCCGNKNARARRASRVPGEPGGPSYLVAEAAASVFLAFLTFFLAAFFSEAIGLASDFMASPFMAGAEA